MTIQTVNTGVIPNDGTGDDPRTGASKWNDNFTDTTNMAALLAQTSPSDVTSGRGVTTDTYQPNVSQGLGVSRTMHNNTGGTIADGFTLSGTSLNISIINAAGVTINTTTASSGMWTHISGATLAAGEFGLFTKIS